MRTLPLLLAGVAAFAPARSSLRSRRPPAPGAVKLEGDAKTAMTEVREKIGVREDGDFYDLDASPWAAIRDDFPALASLSDEELRARLGAEIYATASAQWRPHRFIYYAGGHRRARRPARHPGENAAPSVARGESGRHRRAGPVRGALRHDTRGPVMSALKLNLCGLTRVPLNFRRRWISRLVRRRLFRCACLQNQTPKPGGCRREHNSRS